MHGALHVWTVEKNGGAEDTDGRVRDCVLGSSQEDLTNRVRNGTWGLLKWNSVVNSGNSRRKLQQQIVLAWKGQMAEPHSAETDQERRRLIVGS